MTILKRRLYGYCGRFCCARTEHYIFLPTSVKILTNRKFWVVLAHLVISRAHC